MRTLLVIDNEASTCYAFRRVFSGADVRVLTAGTGTDCLALVRSERPERETGDQAAPPVAERDLVKLIETCLRESEGRAHVRVIAEVERVLFVQALRQTHGNLTRASQLLGLYRTTLRTKLRALGLSLEKVLVPEEASLRLFRQVPA